MRVESFLDDQVLQFEKDVELLFTIDVTGSPDLITFGPVKALNLFTNRVI
jgi:hypothetical protein